MTEAAPLAVLRLRRPVAMLAVRSRVGLFSLLESRCHAGRRAVFRDEFCDSFRRYKH